MRIVNTNWARIYLSGPIDVAKQVIRKDCMREGLCVTIEPTTFIYTGGEESGYVVGLVNYPRFPLRPKDIEQRARHLLRALLAATYQRTALLVMVDKTEWYDAEKDLKPDPIGEMCGGSCNV